MNSILGFVVGILQSALSLIGFVQQHPELPQPAQDQATHVATQAITQATQALSETQQSVNSGLVITSPSAGGKVSAGEQITIRWRIPKAVLSSFPSDFNLGLFLNVVRNGDYDVSVYGINDGTNDPRSGSVVWKVPADVAPGSYKIVAYLVAVPKDAQRMCDPAYSAHKDCSPNPADASVMARAAPYKAESGWFTISNPTSVSVPGMTKYTDSDFGFSFWYPAGWSVRKGPVGDYEGALPPGSHLGDAVATSQLDVSDGKVHISITKLSSDTRSVHVGNDYYGFDTFYFDANAHTWMDSITNAANGSPDRTVPADVSNNTMGGLHIFSGGARFGVSSLIPLSAHHFLLVATSDVGGPTSQTPLVKTIVATDPSVATPISAAEQTATIQAEKDAFEGASNESMSIGQIVTVPDGAGVKVKLVSIQQNSATFYVFNNYYGTESVIEQKTIKVGETGLYFGACVNGGAYVTLNSIDSTSVSVTLKNTADLHCQS